MVSDVIQKLRNEVLQIEGFQAAGCHALDLSLGPLREAFHGSSFPVSAVHEFICNSSENVAATCGFVSGFLGVLMKRGGITLWVSTAPIVFPPGLIHAGIVPDRIIFVTVKKDSDVAWVLDEALKCPALTSVVGELRDLDFTSSRRYQLAVEQSHVTGFIIRRQRKDARQTPNACVSRWRVSHLPGIAIDNLPGMGIPNWNVELLKIRNGRTGAWKLMLENGAFKSTDIFKEAKLVQKKAG